MKSATAAAEPLDDPPGVCIGFTRMRGRTRMPVGEFGRHRLAEQDRPGGLRQRRGACLETRPAPGIDRRAVAGRHVGGIENVLDAERHAPQHGRARRPCRMPAPRRAPAPDRARPRRARPGRARGCGRGSSGRRSPRSARRPRSAARARRREAMRFGFRHGQCSVRIRGQGPRDKPF